VVIATYVADEEPPGRSIVGGPVGVAQPERPDRVNVRAVAIVERIVGRNGTVLVDPMDLPTRTRQKLRGSGVEVLAGGEVDLAVVAEGDGAAVVFGVRVLWILVQDELAAGDGAVQGRVGGEPRHAVVV